MFDVLKKMKEFSCRDAECWLHSCSYTEKWTCTLKIKKDGDELKFESDGETPEEAFGAAHAKYVRVINKVPAYNPNRLIEATPLSADESRPLPDAGDDDLLF